MLRLCYCGVVALKLRRSAVLDLVLKHITELEQAHTAKAGSKPETTLLTELLRWRDEVSRLSGPRIRGDAGELTASVVSIGVVDHFISEAWGVAVTYGADRRRRLVSVPARPALLKKLTSLLVVRLKASPRVRDSQHAAIRRLISCSLPAVGRTVARSRLRRLSKTAPRDARSGGDVRS